MALSLQYVGARPYCEIKVGKHHRIGFARGQTRDDVPEDLIRNKIIPMIDNGGTAWKVHDSKAKDMASAIKKPPAKKAKAVAAVEKVAEIPQKVVEIPQKVVEKVKETVLPAKEEEPLPPISDKEVDVDILLAAAGFDSKMTRAQMMSWCSDKGIAVNNRSTKASMMDQAREHITGASE